MLTGSLIHPQILSSLGRAGHGAMVLISDGNYPHSSGVNEQADVVYLNLRPGLVGAVDVLTAVASAVPVEAAAVMQPDTGPEPEIFTQFADVLKEVAAPQRLSRSDFYERARGRDVVLAIATGEQRTYANILLTIGVVQPPAH